MKPNSSKCPLGMSLVWAVVLVGVTTAFAPATIAAETKTAPAPTTSMVARDTAKTLVHTFLSSWEKGDAQAFAACLHPEVVFAYPGGRLNKAELTSLFANYQKEKRDIRIYFADFFITNGQRHVTAYQFAATDRDSGHRFAVGTGVICKIADGKIIEFKEYWDSQVAPRQKAGELPLDEGIVSPWPDSVWLRPDTID